MGVHLVNYLNYDDLDLVLRRIPEEHKTRLGKVLLRQGAMAFCERMLPGVGSRCPPPSYHSKLHQEDQ